jgi:hypothetical protein
MMPENVGRRILWPAVGQGHHMQLRAAFLSAALATATGGGLAVTAELSPKAFFREFQELAQALQGEDCPPPPLTHCMRWRYRFRMLSAMWNYASSAA